VTDLKKTYLSPELQISAFETEDVLNFSVVEGGAGYSPVVDIVVPLFDNND
jgi:hypothetical protein